MTIIHMFYFKSARIHRRRYNSEGRSQSEETSADTVKPSQSSSSPSHSKKSQSSSNLLTIPFEQYQQQVEEQARALSRPRQRYRGATYYMLCQ